MTSLWSPIVACRDPRSHWVIRGRTRIYPRVRLLCKADNVLARMLYIMWTGESVCEQVSLRDQVTEPWTYRATACYVYLTYLSFIYFRSLVILSPCIYFYSRYKLNASFDHRRGKEAPRRKFWVGVTGNVELWTKR